VPDRALKNAISIESHLLSRKRQKISALARLLVAFGFARRQEIVPPVVRELTPRAVVSGDTI